MTASTTNPTSSTPSDFLDSVLTRTFSCAACERIFSDSSHLLSQNQQRSLTFSYIICTVSKERKTSYSDWDENSIYCDILCSKCTSTLGRTYLGTPAELLHLQGRFTVDIENIAVYTHGDTEPALRVVENSDVARLLNPDQEELAEEMYNLKKMLVCLIERVGHIAKCISETDEVVGVGIEPELAMIAKWAGGEEEGGEEEKKREGLLERVARLEELRTTAIKGGVLGGGMEEIVGSVEQLRTKLEMLEKRMANNEVEKLARSVEHLGAKLDGLAQLEAKVNHIDILETKLNNLETDIRLLSPKANGTVIVSIPEITSPIANPLNGKCQKRNIGDFESATPNPLQKRLSPPLTQHTAVPNSQSTEGGASQEPEDTDHYVQRRKSNRSEVDTTTTSRHKRPRSDSHGNEFVPESDEEDQDIRRRRRTTTAPARGLGFDIVVGDITTRRMTRLLDNKRKSGGR